MYEKKITKVLNSMMMVCILETRFRIKLIFFNDNDYTVKDIISYFFRKFLLNVLFLHVLKSKESTETEIFVFVQVIFKIQRYESL